MYKTQSQIKKIALNYAENLQKKGITPSKIILYGSYAKGKPNQWSDFDFIVISSDLSKYSYLKRLMLLSLASANMKESIEAFGYAPDEISNSENKTSALWAIARKTGKIVYSK